MVRKTVEFKPGQLWVFASEYPYTPVVMFVVISIDDNKRSMITYDVSHNGCVFVNEIMHPSDQWMLINDV